MICLFIQISPKKIKHDDSIVRLGITVIGCTCYLYIYYKIISQKKMNSEFEKFTIKRFVLGLLDWVMLVFLFLSDLLVTGSR